jgi:hypothetical protein
VGDDKVDDDGLSDVWYDDVMLLLESTDGCIVDGWIK